MGGKCCGQKPPKPSVQSSSKPVESSVQSSSKPVEPPVQPSPKPVEPPVQPPPKPVEPPVQPPPKPVELPAQPSQQPVEPPQKLVHSPPEPVQQLSGPGLKPRPINPSDIIAEEEIELQISSLSKKLNITVRGPSSLKCKDLYQQVRQSTDKEFLLGYKGKILEEDHKEIEALGISSNAELECYFKPQPGALDL